MNGTQGYLLVVEDDPDILKLLETTLRFRGYRVVTTQNGREGLEAVQRERPALIIADIMMPEMDGFGLVHRLHIDPATRDIPVIFITATYVTEEDQEFALSIGITRFIQKPIDFEKFLGAIAEILEKGAAVVHEPLKELNFFEGYRQRLVAKLKQKELQIERDENLLETLPNEDKEALQLSLRQALGERDELQLLLGQIHEQMEKLNNKVG
jgi:CheY-like chemotaxis protein